MNNTTQPEEIISLPQGIPADTHTLREVYKQAPAITLAEVSRHIGQVQWLWPNWIPLGTTTLLVGPQAVGKSYLAAEIIATAIGAHRDWPDGQENTHDPSPVILLETEEFRHGYCERLAAMKVDLSQVYLPGEDPWHIPQLPADCDHLLELIIRLDAKLVILDSLTGGHLVDENSAEMKTILQKFNQLALQTQCAIMVIHHVRKRNMLEEIRVTLDRIRGSSTISQFARSVIALWRWEEHDLEAPVRVEQIKNSFTRPPKPFGFTITDDGLAFQNAPEEDKPPSALEYACQFLDDFLFKPRSSTEVLEAARAQGISERTLRRARAEMGVNVYKTNGTWYWEIPL